MSEKVVVLGDGKDESSSVNAVFGEVGEVVIVAETVRHVHLGLQVGWEVEVDIENVRGGD